MAHILVIDDQDTVRQVLSTALQMFGHVVVAANDGKEGLRLFAEEHPDLVITDVLMPVMDGFQVLTTLRRDHPEVPVIVMSGTGEERCSRYLNLINSYKSASVIVLRKPFSAFEIEQALEAVLPTRPPSWINPEELR